MLKNNLMRRATTPSKALLAAGLLGAAISGLSAGSANAADTARRCTFGGYLSPPNPTCASEWSSSTAEWKLGDKIFKLTEFSAFDETAPPAGLLSFIWDDLGPVGVDPTDVYNVLVDFIPSIPPTTTGSYSYTLAITDPNYYFNNVELDVNHSGTGQEVTKTIAGIADLVSIDGAPAGPVTLPEGLTSIAVKDSWVLDPATGRVSSISNVFSQKTTVPGPVPLLGAGAAFGFSRRLRRRLKGGSQTQS